MYCLLFDDGTHASQTLMYGQGENKIKPNLGLWHGITHRHIYLGFVLLE